MSQLSRRAFWFISMRFSPSAPAVFMNVPVITSALSHGLGWTGIWARPGGEERERKKCDGGLKAGAPKPSSQGRASRLVSSRMSSSSPHRPPRSARSRPQRMASSRGLRLVMLFSPHLPFLSRFKPPPPQALLTAQPAEGTAQVGGLLPCFGLQSMHSPSPKPPNPMRPQARGAVAFSDALSTLQV